MKRFTSSTESVLPLDLYKSKTGKVWNSVGNAACCWYYYDEDALLTTGRGTKDWNVYRYAEALLDAAESIAQSTGVTAEAAGYLAQVKARANMEGKTAAEIASSLQSMGKQAFIEECWTERLRELPLEFKMWICVYVQACSEYFRDNPGTSNLHSVSGC
nr:RagB/SusD family nutrient uptake outer membrane protein [Parabacteroides distasonis]